MSRESVRSTLKYDDLNGFYVCACDIKNSYLQIPISEKHFTICGPEFGLENIGKKSLIIHTVYGGKSSGKYYWRHVRYAMVEMGLEY